jgi:pyruvate/2-oxoglutarate dehydrogenase complex dihydrolipoamide dehydrogenase (E3) component
VAVDDHLRTTAEHVWAAGDVAGSPQFTHASWNDYRILKLNPTGGDAAVTGRLVPYTVFTSPGLARVGVTEAQARDQGRPVEVAKIAVAAIPRAKTLHETTGIWRAVVDAETDQILGAALLGHHAGEVISVLQMASSHRPGQTNAGTGAQRMTVRTASIKVWTPSSTPGHEGVASRTTREPPGRPGGGGSKIARWCARARYR